MSVNIGEQLVSSYLKYILKCDFTQTNVYTTRNKIGSQGEIDVLGVDLLDKKIYVCEVAIHLATGLLYTKDGKANNVNKLIEKFTRDIAYANQNFPDFTKIFMLWSPIIKNQKGKEENNQLGHVKKAVDAIAETHGTTIEIIANQEFSDCIQKLREFAAKRTEELACPILRTMQLEEHLKRHLKATKAK